MKKMSFIKSKKVCYVCKIEFSTDESLKKTFRLYHNVRDTGKYREAGHNICNLRYRTLKEIHNHSTYGNHFIINELSKKI